MNETNKKFKILIGVAIAIIVTLIGVIIVMMVKLQDTKQSEPQPVETDGKYGVYTEEVKKYLEKMPICSIVIDGYPNEKRHCLYFCSTNEMGWYVGVYDLDTKKTDIFRLLTDNEVGAPSVVNVEECAANGNYIAIIAANEFNEANPRPAYALFSFNMDTKKITFAGNVIKAEFINNKSQICATYEVETKKDKFNGYTGTIIKTIDFAGKLLNDAQGEDINKDSLDQIRRAALRRAKERKEAEELEKAENNATTTEPVAEPKPAEPKPADDGPGYHFEPIN